VRACGGRTARTRQKASSAIKTNEIRWPTEITMPIEDVGESLVYVRGRRENKENAWEKKEERRRVKSAEDNHQS